MCVCVCVCVCVCGCVCVCVREGGRAWRKEHRKKGFCNVRLIFDFAIVQSLCEQKDFYANFIVQTLQNQFLDWWSFQVIARKITLTQVSFSDKSTFFFRDALVRSETRPSAFRFLLKTFQGCIFLHEEYQYQELAKVLEHQ